MTPLKLTLAALLLTAAALCAAYTVDELRWEWVNRWETANGVRVDFVLKHREGGTELQRLVRWYDKTPAQVDAAFLAEDGLKLAQAYIDERALADSEAAALAQQQSTEQPAE